MLPAQLPANASANSAGSAMEPMTPEWRTILRFITPALANRKSVSARAGRSHLEYPTMTTGHAATVAPSVGKVPGNNERKEPC
jgi:hypothetical protein